MNICIYTSREILGEPRRNSTTLRRVPELEQRGLRSPKGSRGFDIL